MLPFYLKRESAMNCELRIYGCQCYKLRNQLTSKLSDFSFFTNDTAMYLKRGEREIELLVSEWVKKSTRAAFCNTKL